MPRIGEILEGKYRLERCVGSGGMGEVFLARHLHIGKRVAVKCLFPELAKDAASLLHQPKILFLDEPTIGLDAVSKLAVRDFIHHLNGERGVTVILTTHDMDDIEALCSRVMVIGEGHILSDGSLESLRQKVTRERRLIIDLADEGATIYDQDATMVGQDGHRVTLAFDPERAVVLPVGEMADE